MRTLAADSRRLVALLIIVLMALPAAGALGSASAGLSKMPSPPPSSAGATLAPDVLDRAPAAAIPYTEPGRSVAGAVDLGATASGTRIPILVTFEFANSSRLATLLGELQDPKSPQYHHYLTASQFDREFGTPTATYESAVSYFTSVGATNVRTYADRVSVSFDVTPAVAVALFHTTLHSFEVRGSSYYAPLSAPKLPAPLAGLVAGVVGLSSYSALVDHPLHTAPVLHSGGHSRLTSVGHSISGYPAPVQSGSVQFEFASDFQVAYDEQSLFATSGYPTDMVAATILAAGQYGGPPITTRWGNLSTGQNVGPFVPSDVNDFYNYTLPAGEPHASVHGVPLNGAPAPGPLSSYDNTGSNVENTLDLEMLGSTAPGASIYNVYSFTLSFVDADTDFAYILNPNSTTPALANVSVISNSWGGTDTFDAGWNASTAISAARGITVLVASGDSGSNPNGFGGNFDPPGQVTFFPASMAFDTYGDIAVGGTTVTLDPATLQMSSDIVWNESTAWTSPGQPAGSTGGISAIFAAPNWQNSTSANTLIGGTGRGVPDIAAIANNTIMTLSENGRELNASNASTGGPSVEVAGTSVACPLTAGMVLEADHVLGKFHDPSLGFLDPQLYHLGNTQYTTLPTPSPTAISGYYVTNLSYDTALPTLPFYDVVTGQNFVFNAQVGYDLVTGWGSMDAYNYTMYFVTYLPANVPGALSSLRADFNLTGLVGTSTSGYYNASIQQNFFVADALGAPIYWVQNVIYIHGVPGAWQMNFTGWVVFPFWGLYPADTVYEFNSSLTVPTLGTPLSFTIETTLENTTVYNGQSAVFSFGVSGETPISVPLPGGSYILGGLSNDYSWGGNSYSNNPLEGGADGSLSPQFGLVGGPSSGVTTFQSPTGGNLQLWFERFGSATWIPGTTQGYGPSIDQTGEGASGLVWTLTTPANLAAGTPANWTLTVTSGATDQGVLEYDSATVVSTYLVTVSEVGLPAGSLWGLDFNTGQFYYTFGTQVGFPLANGTYTWYGFGPSGYSYSPSQGQLVVAGALLQFSITFTIVRYAVTVTAVALPIGYNWWANATVPGSRSTTSVASTLTTLVLELYNGTWNVTFGAQSNWTPHPPRAQLFIAGGPASFQVVFDPPPKYLVKFAESGLPTKVNWSVTVTGLSGPVNATSSSPTTTLVNGSYSYVAVAAVGGYFAVSGVFGVDGVPHEVLLAFVNATFGITFRESGLPTQSPWALQIAGGPYLSSLTDSITWPAPNGTYGYTVLSKLAGWTATPVASGEVTVDGSAPTVAIAFHQVTYLVTFTLVGLTPGATWGISVDGGAVNSSAGNSLKVDLANGTYSYVVSLPAGWIASPSTGAFTVAGQAGIVVVTAAQKTATSSPSGGFGLGMWGYILVGVVVIAVLAVALWTLRRRPPPRPTHPPAASKPAGAQPTSDTPN
ncbi:MAG: S8 family serine peptidase [Thermoplasmata archaeon]|nr:S8 family serine peptidase [Thermoplasmata archaeon]